jgi:hypothetical protein
VITKSRAKFASVFCLKMASLPPDFPEITSLTEEYSEKPLNLCVQDNVVSQSRGTVRSYTFYIMEYNVIFTV